MDTIQQVLVDLAAIATVLDFLWNVGRWVAERKCKREKQEK